MLFNSIDFFFFFIIVTSLYFLLPYKLRWILLLASSCYFYMAFVPIYILILIFTIIIDYLAGIYIENASGTRRKLFLVISLVANIGVLAVFKYYNFINENITIVLKTFSIHNPIPALGILLPIGLSFHTFQAMSYTIEVYRGNQKAERHFGMYSLYVMFYPQLVAGPIERPQNLLHQFRENYDFDYVRITQGLKLILWGLFKKIVIADRLSIFVNAVYNNVPEHSGPTFYLATLFFAFQIYCDFSGYSDIAIGTAKVMGFKLMTNFNLPYFSKDISEFWKRWHISLSTWFKDYLYISLGGNRCAIPRWYLNLFIVFLISGLWHGANWTYIIWGSLNGFYLIFAIISYSWRERLNTLIGLNRNLHLKHKIQILMTFALICFSWIFFRANTIQDAFTIIHKMTSFGDGIFIGDQDNFVYSIMAIFILLIAEIKLEYFRKSFSLLNNNNVIIRYLVYIALLIYAGLFGVFDAGQFIYFQF